MIEIAAYRAVKLATTERFGQRWGKKARRWADAYRRGYLDGRRASGGNGPRCPAHGVLNHQVVRCQHPAGHVGGMHRFHDASKPDGALEWTGLNAEGSGC